MNNSQVVPCVNCKRYMEEATGYNCVHALDKYFGLFSTFVNFIAYY